jgi:hypothetical protein
MNTHPVTQLCLDALQVAKTQLGVTEQSGNRGPKIKDYLNSIGLDEGYSWCAAFVFWCFRSASRSANIINPLPKTGSVLKHWELTKAPKVKMPRVGDIFVIDHGKGLGHTGFVKLVNVLDKTYTTVEGNSNTQGSRTGGMVCSNTRKIADAKGFIRY